MHTEMWEHPAVQANLATLRARGVHVVEPESGRLAGGDIGHGRLADPERHRRRGRRGAARRRRWPVVHVVVSAGGTREPIDAVRVIANRSCGKQGYAIAAEAAARGARVTLVSTVDLPVPAGRRRCVPVETAAQMQAALEQLAPTADVVVMAAAVADFRPVAAAEGKIKKDQGVPQIVLEPTPDILAGLGAVKPAGPGAGRVRRRDQRPAGQRAVEARAQAPRPRSSPTTSARRVSASSTTPTPSPSLQAGRPAPHGGRSPTKDPLRRPYWILCPRSVPQIHHPIIMRSLTL